VAWQGVAQRNQAGLLQSWRWVALGVSGGPEPANEFEHVRSSRSLAETLGRGDGFRISYVSYRLKCCVGFAGFAAAVRRMHQD
jgi:hypothetical protein